MEAYKWSKTAASNNAAVPDGAPDNWLGQNVNEWARELMARLREVLSDACYVDENYNLPAIGAKTITRISSTQFRVDNCDATSVFTALRWIRVIGSFTAHGQVVSSSYVAPNTTVTVELAGGVPTSPTQALVHVDKEIRSAAFQNAGDGNGLIADEVDGYHALDIIGAAINADTLINGSMSIWQRGTSGSCAAGVRTYHADRWFTLPSGAAVTCARTTTVPTGSVVRYAKQITGAASVTTCEIVGQRIESIAVPFLKAQSAVTFSALVKNDTAAPLVLDLRLGTPAAADDFTTVTNRHSSSFTSIPAGNTQRITKTVAVSGYANIDNGLEVVIRSPSGALDSGAKSITITEIQVDITPAFSFFRVVPFQTDLFRCQRFYAKTFPYATTPAQNAGVAGAIHVASQDRNNTEGAASHFWQFPVQMRAAAVSPTTFVTYNPSAAATSWRNISTGADRAATVQTVSERGALITASAASGQDGIYAIHATADVEL